MLQTFKNGQGSIVLRVKLLDSSSTTGAGLTALTSASSGLIISTIADNEATATAYTVAGSTVETITTLGTYAAPTATKCRFKEVDATNHKGVYELQFADARLAVASAKSLLVSIAGATNLAQADFVVQLQSDDPYVAKPTNSNLLSIDANGRIDVIKLAGTTQTARDIGASVLLSSGTGAGQISLSSGLVTLAGVTHTGAVIPTVTTLTNLPAITANWLTSAGIDTSALNGKGDWNIGKTGYSLTQTFPTNFADLAITVTTGRVTAGTVSDKTGYSISGTKTTLDALTDITAAQVNAEVVDALNVDTYAEPGQGTPGSTIALAAKINYLYKAWRNKSTQTSTTYSLFNDDAATVDHKATVSDDGTTATKGEVATGP